MDAQRTPVLLILTIWLGGLCAALQFAKVSVIFPQLALAYPEAGAALGFVVSIISFVGLLLGLVGGILAARIGFRRLLLGALALGAVISLYQATLPPLVPMLLSRLLEGFSHLAVVIAAPTLIAQYTTDRSRPFFLTLWGSFFGVGFALTAWLGAPLVEARGIGTLFLVHAALTAAVFVALFVALPRAPRVRTAGTRPVRLGELGRDHLRIYGSPRLGAPALGWIFYTLTFVSLITLLPGEAPAESEPLLRTFMPLAGIAVSLTLGAALLARYTAVTVIVLGFAASLVCGVLVWALPGVLWPPIALFAATGLVQGASFASVPQLNPVPEDRALANGALAQCGNLGNLTGTPILLAMLGGMGWDAILVFAVVSYAAGMAVHLWAAARRRRIALVA